MTSKGLSCHHLVPPRPPNWHLGDPSLDLILSTILEPVRSTSLEVSMMGLSLFGTRGIVKSPFCAEHPCSPYFQHIRTLCSMGGLLCPSNPSDTIGERICRGSPWLCSLYRCRWYNCCHRGGRIPIVRMLGLSTTRPRIDDI